ncbi:hypothetical protein GOODEAATRI_030053 [Goodea atripinnis]|uniref:Peptidase S1 domain-containing protein n=1 Tax=Goodea atripinnis TaxID=208336 RepID=A0ABV0MLX4_9TELE
MWPWMASLQKRGQHVCGGTLVSESSVLTNADCFPGSLNASEWTVVLGRLKQNGSNQFEESLNVVNISMSNLTGNNIAVLKLSSQPTLNNYIQPICLDNKRTFPVGSVCWAAGWSSGRGGGEPKSQRLTVMLIFVQRLVTRTNANQVNLPEMTAFLFPPTLEEQALQQFQATVVDCGNATTTDSMCTANFTLEQVQDNICHPSEGYGEF